MFPVRSLMLMLGLQILGCSLPEDESAEAPPEPVDPGAEEAAFADDLPEAVIDDLVHGIPSRLVVHLGVEAVPEYAEADPRYIEAFAERWPGVLSVFEDTLPDRAFVHRSYEHLPVVSVDVDDLGAAYAILDHPDVVSVQEDLILEKTDASALPYIRQPEAAAEGYTGDGTAIVVIDTGLNYRHSDFGCTAPGVPASCPVVAVGEFAPNDNQLDADGHGTNVSAIALSVAPEADIIGLDVFQGSGASLTDILDALDWSVANQATYNIASINMSLGLGGYTSPCTTTPFEAGIAAAKAAGMSVVVASGNDSQINAISTPACAPSAFSVGAVFDQTETGWGHCMGDVREADRVVCFSNSASFLDLLAPGYNVTGGGHEMSGTSMAAPHVAGAMAVLRAADPNATVAELEQRLQDTGVTVTDHRNGLSFRRLDLAAAVDGLGCTFRVDPSSLTIDPLGESGSITVTADSGCTFEASSSATWLSVTPESGDGTTTLTWTALPNASFERSATLSVGPVTVTATQGMGGSAVGNLTIAEGAAATKSTVVWLELDAPGSDRMCISNKPDSCTAWEPYKTEKRWRLTARASGVYQVYAWFSSGGIVGQPVSDDIVYDRFAPKGGELTVGGAVEGITLSWSGFTDDYTGVASFKVVQQESVRRLPGGRCTTGTTVYEGSDSTVYLPGLDGEYSWRVCPVDAAGNVGIGLTASLETRPEYTPPE
ncbi:MAG: S8 family serine peptidase, partial [Myxococcota bacterium]